MKTNKQIIMKATHQVLDLVYTPEQGHECFEGTEQGGTTFMYKVVPHN